MNVSKVTPKMVEFLKGMGIENIEFSVEKEDEEDLGSIVLPIEGDAEFIGYELSVVLYNDYIGFTSYFDLKSDLNFDELHELVNDLNQGCSLKFTIEEDDEEDNIFYLCVDYSFPIISDELEDSEIEKLALTALEIVDITDEFYDDFKQYLA